MREKLRSARGETLVELLCAILIGTLAVALLCSLAMTSVRMDRSAREADKTFNKSLNGAETRTDVTDETGTVVPPVSGAEVTVRNTADPDNDSYKARPPVKFYGGEGAVSYALSP